MKAIKDKPEKEIGRNQFEYKKEIGSGNFGCVFKGNDSSSHRDYIE